MSAADRVYLEHPDLPGQGIRVRPSAVPTHRASGWQPADEPQPLIDAGLSPDEAIELVRSNDLAVATEEPKPEPQPRRRRAPRHTEGDEQ